MALHPKIYKIIEGCLSLIVLYLLIYTKLIGPFDLIFAVGAADTFTIICVVIYIGITSEQRFSDLLTNLIFSAIGCVMFIIGGCGIFYEFFGGWAAIQGKIAYFSAFLMLINGGVFGYDAFLLKKMK